MSAIYLGIIFFVIIALLAFRRPLYVAFLGGLVITVILYRIPPITVLERTANVFLNWSSLSVLVSLYLITYLQRMLEARKQIKMAGENLNRIFHSRKINAAGASLFIGLLPSPAAMLLCGDLVKDATEGYLKPREQAFVTSWFRHIPESSLPTYAGVLLVTNLSGVPLGKFMLGMIIPVLVLGLLGYYPYLHRLPKNPVTEKCANRGKEFIAYTGVLEQMPDILGKLPLPTYLIFVLLFFAGAVISGTNGIIALGTPLAFAAMDGGMPLVVLLMCICHAANQISPTHICVMVAADYFHVSFSSLIRKTLPVSILFCVLMIAYYHLLLLIGV